MKWLFLMVVFVAGSYSAGAQQKLKDLLYSGKLKNDSNTVIRKTDDLSTKIDTSERKPEVAAQPADIAKPMTLMTPADTAASKAVKPATAATTTAPVVTTSVNAAGDSVDTVTQTVTSVATETAPPPPPAAPKSNNRIWKEFTDAMVKEMKGELDGNKKIKKETYYVTVEYEIETTGDVGINNVISQPENAMLQAVVKDKIMAAPPKMAPVPKKVKRKYNFTIVKD